MLKHLVLGASALVATATALPAEADARHRYPGGYYGRTYYGNGYYPGRYYRRHCNSGTTGMIIGGAAGALIGREIDRSTRRGYYGYRGNGTTGLILGGAAGALIGREIGRTC